MHYLSPAALRRIDHAALEALLGRSDLVIAAGAGELRGLAAAALLFAGYSVLDKGATLVIDVPEAWAGATWRIGRRALRFLGQREPLSSAEAEVAGLCDEVIDGEPEVWLERWKADRSELALDSAALLVTRRGGDRLERAEFARLFAIGEPQRGLEAFLARRKPKFPKE
jgi:enoyl-CoA hydratase/carnithine racemase